MNARPTATLDARTRALRDEGRPALVAYLTALYPDAHTFEEVVRAADAAGCDVIEIGIPFSDPIADGPVIQAASTRALASGATMRSALEAAARLAPELRAALVVMTYVNPVLAMGVDAFARRAAECGVRGVILPDVPDEESEPFRTALEAAGLAPIDLLAPTSPEARIARIAPRARGFVYLVSVAGVTGPRDALPDDLGPFVERVRRHTTTPLYVGFGVSSPEQAAEVTRRADGVIIGSRLIRAIDQGDAAGAPDRVGAFLAGVREAIDAGRAERGDAGRKTWYRTHRPEGPADQAHPPAQRPDLPEGSGES